MQTRQQTNDLVCCVLRAGDSMRPKRYFPFAEGPRNCVGQNLAKVSLLGTMATLMQHFTFRLADEVTTPTLVLYTGCKNNCGIWYHLLLLYERTRLCQGPDTRNAAVLEPSVDLSCPSGGSNLNRYTCFRWDWFFAKGCINVPHVCSVSSCLASSARSVLPVFFLNQQFVSSALASQDHPARSSFWL